MQPPHEYWCLCSSAAFRSHCSVHAKLLLLLLHHLARLHPPRTPRPLPPLRLHRRPSKSSLRTTCHTLRRTLPLPLGVCLHTRMLSRRHPGRQEFSARSSPFSAAQRSARRAGGAAARSLAMDDERLLGLMVCATDSCVCRLYLRPLCVMVVCSLGLERRVTARMGMGQALARRGRRRHRRARGGGAESRGTERRNRARL